MLVQFGDVIVFGDVMVVCGFIVYVGVLYCDCGCDGVLIDVWGFLFGGIEY